MPTDHPAAGAPRSPTRIPNSYLPATWRTTLPLCDDGTVAFALNLPDGQVLRVRLDAEDARFLRQTLEPAYWAPAGAPAPADQALHQQREEARRHPPYWPFAQRTPEQERIQHPAAARRPA